MSISHEDREKLNGYVVMLADLINANCHAHEVGNLQRDRVARLNLSKPPTTGIFKPQSTMVGKDDLPYAFHAGGQTELQFNVGFESEANSRDIRFRHGVALSFQNTPNHKYKDNFDEFLRLSHPKAERFYKCIQKIMGEQATSQENFQTWYWNAGKLHDDDVPPVTELVQDDVFYMFGKHVSLSEFKEVATDEESIIEHWTQKVLDDFDFLYENVYCYVESNAD